MLPKCENWLHVTLDGRKDMWTLLNVSSTHDKHTWHGCGNWIFIYCTCCDWKLYSMGLYDEENAS